MLGVREALKERVALVSEGTQECSEKARLKLGGQVLVDLLESAVGLTKLFEAIVGGTASAAVQGLGRLEGRPWIVAVSGAFDDVGMLEEPDETPGLLTAESSLCDGECSRHLLLGWQPGEPVGDRDAEESLGKKVSDVTFERLENPQSSLDPDLSSSERP